MRFAFFFLVILLLSSFLFSSFVQAESKGLFTVEEDSEQTNLTEEINESQILPSPEIEEEEETFFQKIKNFFIRIFDFFSLPFPLVSAFSIPGQFVVEEQPYCGDGIVNPDPPLNEECDLTNLSEETCVTLGYDGGTLTCTVDCFFNQTLCTTSPGGNGGGGGSNPPKQCNDNIDNDEDGFCDYDGCTINGIFLEADPGCTNTYDDSEINAVCISKWECRDWTACENGTRSRICFDVNYCNDVYKKIEKQ